MAKSELEKYKQHVSSQLSNLSPLLQSYALGDFSRTLEIPDKENEFTELLVGLSLLYYYLELIYVTYIKQKYLNLYYRPVNQKI